MVEQTVIGRALYGGDGHGDCGGGGLNSQSEDTIAVPPAGTLTVASELLVKPKL